jgi:TonB family protein
MSAGVGGGQVLLEVMVGGSGEVAAITPLRTTPSFTEITVDAVRKWRFVPAPAGASRVLVAAVFRPPTINSPALGEPIRDIAAGSGETPFPISVAVPPFPPRARDPGVVLVEADVAATGAVVNVRVVRSAPPFDGPARDAVRQWTFRPARIAGNPVRSFAYILFGFPIPRV